MSNSDNSPLQIAPGTKVRLRRYDPADTSLMPDKVEAEKEIQKDIEKLEDLQQRLYASNRYALLIVLQGIDASGKDGTIKHVMSGVNPQGCSVTAFKTPSAEELNHDFLWRIENATPRRGMIAVFNRSHYEDVLAVRVHKLVPGEIWKARYDQINRFEELKTELGTIVLKFFLHISKQEQKKRLEERLRNPSKNWKFSTGDIPERALWSTYRHAYEDMLTKCSTTAAPWHVVPADYKWYRNWFVARTIVEKLESLNLDYPEPKADLSKIRIE